MACIGIGFPVIPGVLNIPLFCIAVADTIWDDDIEDMLANTLSLAAWSLKKERERKKESERGNRSLTVT